MSKETMKETDRQSIRGMDRWKRTLRRVLDREAMAGEGTLIPPPSALAL